MNFNSENFLFKKGPPDAVIKSFEISLAELLCKIFHIEKCSESKGINSQPYFFSFFLIKGHAQIILSLLAIAIFFEFFIESNNGSKADNPDIPQTTMSVLQFLLFFK